MTYNICSLKVTEHVVKSDVASPTQIIFVIQHAKPTTKRKVVDG
jgi:hypothetical protein